eukprot:COSAG01_NODE_9184_length_2526_cov_471.513591_1_plen_189_part_00
MCGEKMMITHAKFWCSGDDDERRGINWRITRRLHALVWLLDICAALALVAGLMNANLSAGLLVGYGIATASLVGSILNHFLTPPSFDYPGFNEDTAESLAEIAKTDPCHVRKIFCVVNCYSLPRGQLIWSILEGIHVWHIVQYCPMCMLFGAACDIGPLRRVSDEERLDMTDEELSEHEYDGDECRMQ